MNTETVRPAWIPRAAEALNRAALRARDVAIQTDSEVLVTIDCKTVTMTAEELRAERKNVSASSANPRGGAA